MNDNEKLTKLLEASIQYDEVPRRNCMPATNSPAESQELEMQSNLIQWSSGDDKIFFGASRTYAKLPSGVYEIKTSSMGLYFDRVPVDTSNLIRFPQTNSEIVIDEIQKFWERESVFREYNITYKRGILLWGPPGGGKTCCVKFLCNDVISRNGIVVKFDHPAVFREGLRILRAIEPSTPVVVLLEDIDVIINMYSESEVLNTLDGVERLDKIVFLATTNYPERLGPRIVNRPSRFDKRFLIDHPNAESRKLYLEYLIRSRRISQINLDMWVQDTEGLSIAHLKELFIAVVILDDKYDEVISTLQSMKEVIDSEQVGRSYLGFSRTAQQCQNTKYTH